MFIDVYKQIDDCSNNLYIAPIVYNKNTKRAERELDSLVDR